MRSAVQFCTLISLNKYLSVHLYTFLENFQKGSNIYKRIDRKCVQTVQGVLEEDNSGGNDAGYGIIKLSFVIKRREGNAVYFPENIEELDRIKLECMQMVNKRALLSGAAAVVPLPGIDISADITIMVELLMEINKRFGLSEQQLNQMDLERKKVLLVIISSVGSELAGRTVSAGMVRSLLKRVSNRVVAKQVSRFVPFAGQAVSAGISYAAMRYLGRNPVEQCYQIALRYMSSIDRRFTGDVIDIT